MKKSLLVMIIITICAVFICFTNNNHVIAAGEKILFVTNRDGNNEIYSMNPDGTSPTRLTNNSADDIAPVWSADGTKILFASARDGNYEIYTMNADGSNQTRLTNNTAYDYYASWSPDGAKIVFTSSRDGNYEIYTMNSNGTNLIRLTINTATDYLPAWSPNGQKIAFASDRDGNIEIYTMNPDGSGPTRLTNNTAIDYYPAWSPDSKKISFTSYRDFNYEIYSMNADGGAPTRLTNHAATDYFSAWSTDGTKITFASNRDTNYEIYKMNADGSNLTRLTVNTATDNYPNWGGISTNPGIVIANGTDYTNSFSVILNLTNGGRSITQMCFSNDGITYSDWESFNATKTWVLQSGDGTKTVYVQFKDATGNVTTYNDTIMVDTVSPTGSVIIQNGDIYATSRTVPLSLSASDAAGSGVTQMSFSNDGITFSAWEPFNTSKSWRLSDGNGLKTVSVRYQDRAGNITTCSDTIAVNITEKIVFASNRDGNYQIYHMNPDGGSQTRLTTNTFTDNSPALSKGGKIAFTSNRDGNNEIYVMNADGSGPVRITNHTAADGSPAWSPDGAKIAFSSNRDGNSELYVMNADGSGPTRLTNYSGTDDYPAWSPDGKKIAFIRDSFVYVMNPDGTGLTKLTTYNCYLNPAWAPDGKKIAFSGYLANNYEIIVMNPDGTGIVNLTNTTAQEYMPTWSPDGSKLAFVTTLNGNYEIYTANASGGNLARLTTNTASEMFPSWMEVIIPPSITIANGAEFSNILAVTLNLSDGGNPLSQICFSNDGITYSDWEAFSSTKSWVLSSGEGTKTVYAKFMDAVGNVTINSDTIVVDTIAPGGSIVIQNGDTYARSRTVPLTLTASDGGSGITQMSFSNDGSAYSAWEPFNTGKSWRLSDGNGLKTVSVRYQDKAGNITTCSDTIAVNIVEKIVFASTRDGNYQIYHMDPDGGSQTRLTTNTFNELAPSMSKAGKIAFMSNRDGNNEIYVMNGDGSNQLRITNHPATDGSPAWSPDGAKIAFSSNRDGNSELYVMNADGSGPIRLTNYSGTDDFPAWSPDGKKIAFIRDSFVYVMNSDGTGVTKLTTYNCYNNPAWSPDGKKIAFSGYINNNYEIMVMNPDGTGAVALTNNPALEHMPFWAPDGSKLVFISNRDSNYEIYTMNSSGANLARLTTNTVPDLNPSWMEIIIPPSITIANGAELSNTLSVTIDLCDGGNPVSQMCFSNDGITYSNWEPFTPTKSWVLANGEGPKTVSAKFKDSAGDETTYTDTIAVDTIAPTGSIVIQNGDPYAKCRIAPLTLTASDDGGSGVAQMCFSNDGINYSAWEPFNTSKNWTLSQDDGLKTVYVRFRDQAGNITRSSNTITVYTNDKICFTSNRDGNNEIYLMNPDGSGQSRLTVNPTDDVYPVWAPDGIKIAFVSNRDGNYEIYTMNPDGSNPVRLTNHPAADTTPAWAPDGKKVVFSSNRDGNGEIYVMNADGTGQTRLTNNTATDEKPSWSPDGQKILFTSNRDGNFELYTMNADGSGQTRVTNNSVPDTSPEWAPDGQTITFTSYTGNHYEIYRMNPDGSGKIRLTNDSAIDSSYPSWSPDGSNLVYVFDSQLYRMNPEDGGQTQLTFNTATDLYPSWCAVMMTPSTPPDPTYPQGVTIAGGADFTNTGSVQLNLSDGGSPITEMCFSNDGLTYSEREAFNTRKAWVLDSGDGIKTVYAQFMDVDGNLTTYRDTIIMDSVSPTGGIVIQNDDTYAGSRIVSLTLTASDNESNDIQMSFSNDGTNYSEWEPFSSSKNWALRSGDGGKTVSVRYRDQAGNIPYYSDTIILDLTGPSGSIVINNGNPCTTSNLVTLRLSATDQGSSVSTMRFSNDGQTYTDWEPYASSKENWALVNSEGAKTVYVQYQDLKGNTSQYPGQIYIDLTKPTGSIYINNHDEYTKNVAVTLNISGSDNYGVKQMCFSKDGKQFTSWEPYMNTKYNYVTDNDDITNPAGDGVKTVFVKFRDYADYESEVYRASIILDRNAPTGIVLNNLTNTNSGTGTGCVFAHDAGSGVSLVRFQYSGGSWSPWQMYLSRDLKDYQMGTGGDTRTILTQFKDNYDNVTSDSNPVLSKNQQASLQKNLMVFSSERSGNAEIFIANEDGSSPVNLTQSADQDTAPSWSYDQYQIVFVSNRFTHKDLFTISPEGSGFKRLLKNTNDINPYDNDLPVFSKDGTKIAFVSNRDGHNEIYLYDFPTKTETRLTYCNPGESASYPSWYPDGAKLAYELSANGISSVYELLLADGSTTCLLQGVYAQPAWSPDGLHLAVVTKNGASQSLVVYNRQRNSSSSLVTGNIIQHPSWAPNSDEIAYAAISTTGIKEIYKVKFPATTGPASVSSGSEADPSWGGCPTWLVGQARSEIKTASNGQYYYLISITNADRYSRLKLPPFDNGTGYAISSHPVLNPASIVCGYNPSSAHSEISRISMDDLTRRIVLWDHATLTFDAPEVSPDRLKIAFHGHGGNIGGLYLMTLNTNGTANPPTRLISDTDYSSSSSYPYYDYEYPSWSKDSQWIYYIRENIYQSYRNYNLWKMNLSGANVTQIGNNLLYDMNEGMIISSSGKVAVATKNSPNSYLYEMEPSSYYYLNTLASYNSTASIIPYGWSANEMEILYEFNGDYYLTYYPGYGSADTTKFDLFK